MFGPIGGLIPGVFPVGVGQALLAERFIAGQLDIRHVGIVVENHPRMPAAEAYARGLTFDHDGDSALPRPRLVQAMPGGAEEIEMNAGHWTDRHAYVRLAEDYPGQARNAAAIARLMVQEKVSYSFASYAALAGWKYGLRAERLERWIGRRRPPLNVTLPSDMGRQVDLRLPCEAICSVLVDQAWSLAGKRVMEGVAHQAVTPGALAGSLLGRPGATWMIPHTLL